MMKSFFKKLSLVMALAMVVTLAAPAAQAFAADLIIAGQEEAKADAKEEYSVAVGEEVDFKFYGAAAGWQDLYKWESADETIAKPLVNEKGEQDGRFEGLKDGEVEVTLTIGEQKATVKLVVGEGEVVADTSFAVKQTASDKVTLTWADASLATNKVELYKVFELTSGNVEVKWPVEVAVKDGVATIDAYVEFVDGEVFTIKVDGYEPVGFTAYVGPITSIVVVPMTGDKAVTYGDSSANSPIKFVTKYLAGDIEVSPATNSWMTFEALDPNENVYIDSTGNTSYIYAVGAATRVKATYSYYDANYNIQELTYEFPIVGQPIPVAAFDGVTGYAVVAGTDADSKKVAWGTAELIVGEGAYAAFKYADTLGTAYTFNADNNITTGFGTVSFKSSDETKLLIGDNGYMTAISDGSAVVIVQLTDANNYTRNIYAFEVTLKAARAAKTLTPSVNTVTVLTKDNTDSDTHTVATVDFEVKDQYGKTWDVDSATVTTTVADAPALGITCADGKGKVTVTGADFDGMNVSSVLYTIEAAGVKTNLVVVLKKPATSGEAVVTTGYAVEATGADVNVEAAGNVYATINAYTTWAGYKTGTAGPLFIFDKNDYFTKCEDDLTNGNLVLKVTGPNGALVEVGADNKILVAEVASGSALNVKAGAGKYNVTLYSVTNVKENTGAASGTSLIAYRQVATTTFEVKNTCKTLSVKEYTNDLKNVVATDIKDAVASIVVLQGIDGFTLDADDIVKVNGVLNASAGKCYVSSIVVKTPINETGCYFEQTITIGKTLTVPAVSSIN